MSGEERGLIKQVTRSARAAVKETDMDGAADRVRRLQAQHPEADPARLSEFLIRQKCRQAGAVGAVTSGASIIPGLGTVASLTFGVAADLGLTFRLQSELVLEIAAAHRHQLSKEDQQRVVLLITGLSAGANHILRRAGKEVAEQASERLAAKSVTRAVPVLGVAASAGTNIATTYIIGRRAQEYFSRGPEALADWAESVRALGQADRETLVRWLTDSTERSWQLVRKRLGDASNVALTAGRSLGEVTIVRTNRALRRAFESAWRQLGWVVLGMGRLLVAVATAPWRLARRILTKRRPSA